MRKLKITVRGVERLLESGVAEPGALYLLRREEREQLERRCPQLRGRLLSTAGRSVLFTPQPTPGYSGSGNAETPQP